MRLHFRMRKVLASNLGPETGYNDTFSPRFLRVMGWGLKMVTAASFLILSNLSVIILVPFDAMTINVLSFCKRVIVYMVYQ